MMSLKAYEITSPFSLPFFRFLFNNKLVGKMGGENDRQQIDLVSARSRRDVSARAASKQDRGRESVRREFRSVNGGLYYLWTPRYAK